MPDENIHAIALQISQAAQKYEQYVTEIEALSQRYTGTLVWVESLLGESTADTREIFATIDVRKDQYKQSVFYARNYLLKVSQALIRLEGGQK